MRNRGICVNCREIDELVAFGLCRACYQREWRDRSEVRPDKYSRAERRRGRKIRKALATMVDSFEQLEECGALEDLETKEILRDLIRQLVGRMRKVIGESLLDRLEADLEPCPPGLREYEDENGEDDDDDEGDGEDGVPR
jgi:hypothetical protein